MSLVMAVRPAGKIGNCNSGMAQFPSPPLPPATPFMAPSIFLAVAPQHPPTSGARSLDAADTSVRATAAPQRSLLFRRGGAAESGGVYRDIRLNLAELNGIPAVQP